MAEVSRWIMTPSTMVVAVSGLLPLGLINTFSSAGWVWAKAQIGLLLAKAVIGLVDPGARDMAALARTGLAAADTEASAELARLIRMEWGGRGWRSA